MGWPFLNFADCSRREGERRERINERFARTGLRIKGGEGKVGRRWKLLRTNSLWPTRRCFPEKGDKNPFEKEFSLIGNFMQISFCRIGKPAEIPSTYLAVFWTSPI